MAKSLIPYTDGVYKHLSEAFVAAYKFRLFDGLYKVQKLI
jgi:hypothetical protein